MEGLCSAIAHLIVVLLLCFVTVSRGRIEACSEDFDIDYDSSVTLQNCTTDIVEFAFEIYQAIDIRIELACNDDQLRILLSKNTLQSSSTVVSFDINPPLVTTINDPDTLCVATICYEDQLFYDPYVFQIAPMFYLQRDCAPYNKQIVPTTMSSSSSSQISITGNNRDFTQSLEMDQDIFATVTIIESITSLGNTNVAGPQTSITMTDESIMATTTHSLPLANISTTYHHQLYNISSTSTYHHQLYNTLSTSTTPSVVPYSPQYEIVSSFLYNTDNFNTFDILVSNSMVIITEQPVTDSSQTVIFITMISIILLATSIFVISALLFCIFRIATQYWARRKHDVEDVSPVDLLDIKECVKSYEITPSPSICTILSPLSPIITEDIERSPYYEVITFNGSMRVVPVQSQYSTDQNMIRTDSNSSNVVDGVTALKIENSVSSLLEDSFSTEDQSSNLSQKEEQLALNEESNSSDYMHTMDD